MQHRPFSLCYLTKGFDASKLSGFNNFGSLFAMFHVGLSGYSYKPWHGEGRFYPPELKAKQFFAFYAERYRAVEMDGTWYRMPSTDMVAKWVADSPRPFHFCPKMHRDVTHMKRLKEEGYDAAKFFLKRLHAAAVAEVLGPVLIQLPPNMKIQAERLDSFLAMLPKHSGQMNDESLSESGVPLRYAMEFRNETWSVAEVEEILRKHNVAWVASDTDEKDAERRQTADFSYIRLRKTAYDDADLKEWTAYFMAQDDRDVFTFCKHEDDGSPWIWADALRRLVE